ncbi:hypothetical protein, partial [Enterococcus spodopteracolus]|uniref:hypothetical protein n=1 Tax=Enterococcus spodopteracolus TaxID=3034501 RepID=UPI002649BCB6
VGSLPLLTDKIWAVYPLKTPVSKMFFRINCVLRRVSENPRPFSPLTTLTFPSQAPMSTFF